MITIQEVRSEEEIEKDLNMILRQTDYNREEAKEKLENNFNLKDSLVLL